MAAFCFILEEGEEGGGEEEDFFLDQSGDPRHPSDSSFYQFSKQQVL
jgi:hypothetical protein